jgi:hypothetical protein
MNIYYLKKYRKDAKKQIRIMFVNNRYKVMKYNSHYMEWRLINEWNTNGLCTTFDLNVAKQTLTRERRCYILDLVKEKREFNKTKELAKL